MDLAPPPLPIPFVAPETLAADPAAAFARLRAETPVVRFDTTTYSVLRARDVLALLADPRVVQIDGAAYAEAAGVPEGAVKRFLSEVMVLSNGPTHRARRRPFAKTFAHARIRAMRGEIRAVATRIMAEMPRATPFDFVDRVAARLPAEMIVSLLGLPVEEAGWLSRQVLDLALALSPVYPHEKHGQIEAAAEILLAYVAQAIEARGHRPRGDLLSELAEAASEERGLTPEDLAVQVVGVILGGSDTTRAAFAMTVALILQTPGAWEALCQDPTLIPGAVSEGIRFEPPVGNLPRFVAEPVTVGGAEIPAGSMLALSTVSAMRDPDLYQDPERFDITRTDHPKLHMAFGGGAHRCLGEMLARIEMEEALAALLAAAPDLRLLAPPRMEGFGGIRHITPMEVQRG